MHPHPTLRHESRTIRRVDQQLRDIVKQMFALMYEAKGVGLAANQVDLPLRMFVTNLTADPSEGEEFVFINPVISRPRGNAEDEEGCLSVPGVYGSVRRPKQVRINAYTLNGEEIVADVDGLMARVVQHETDHLDGVMFTDRMSETGKMGILDQLTEFEIEFKSKRDTGEIPPDDDIRSRLSEWEEKYA